MPCEGNSASPARFVHLFISLRPFVNDIPPSCFPFSIGTRERPFLSGETREERKENGIMKKKRKWDPEKKEKMGNWKSDLKFPRR